MTAVIQVMTKIHGGNALSTFNLLIIRITLLISSFTSLQFKYYTILGKHQIRTVSNLI